MSPPPPTGPGCVPRAQGEAVPGLHRGACAGALGPRRWGADRLLGSAGAGPLGMWAECPLSPGGTGHRERDFPPMLTPTPTHSLPSRRPGGGPLGGGPRRTAPSGAAWVPCPRWGSVPSEAGSAGPFWAAGVPLWQLLPWASLVFPRCSAKACGRMQARPDPVLTVKPGWAGPRPPDLALRPGTAGGPQPRGALALRDMLSPSARSVRAARSSGRSGPARACGGGLCTFTMAQPVHAPRGRAGRGLPGAAA